MTRLYRLVTTLLTLAILVTACGGQPAAEDAATPPEEAVADTEESNAEAEAEEASGVEEVDTEATSTEEDGADEAGTDETEAATAAGECDEGFRLLDHEMLATDPVCIPENPERVVALDPAALEVMLLTDQKPVGAVSWLLAIYSNSYDYLAPDIGGIEDVGFPPNLESIAALNPDLIIVGFTEEYEELSQIAPTLQYTLSGSGDWRRPMEMAGEALNQSEAVSERFAEYEARVATLADTIGDPSELEVSILRVSSEQLMINLVQSYPSVIVDDVGFARPESQALSVEEAEGLYESAIGGFISLEEIPRVDGDVVFVWSQEATVEGNTEADVYYQSIQDQPVWQTLEAVQNDRVYRVGGHWIGWGFYAAHAVIDDLFTYVAEVDPAEVAPNPFLGTE
ncbi:MAG: iron-siderophore ABC transporter substrate-binding protein [Chloroflexota bacterium]